MSLAVNVPDDVARRLKAAAAANGVSLNEFVTAVLINSVPEVADASERRHLAFVGIGDSEQGASHCLEALLDDGFGSV